jgi:hypothetical protein
MNTLRIEQADRIADIDWMPFPGGELEGRRARALCPECRGRLQRAGAGALPLPSPALCFQCYRLDLERTRRIGAAGELNTASEARFQTALPFEPVNAARLTRLKADREIARASARVGVGLYVEKRRRAQIEARHQLGRLLHGLKQRQLSAAQADGATGAAPQGSRVLGRRSPLAADVRLPESWLPFVVAG